MTQSSQPSQIQTTQMKQRHSVPVRERQTSRVPYRHHHQPRQPRSSPPKTNIFSLPNELLLTIFEHCLDDRIPTLKILCLVNRRFKDLARRLEQQQRRWYSQIGYRPPNSALLVFHAEKDHPYLFPKGHLPCYRCLRVLDYTGHVNFTDNAVKQHKGLGGSERCNRLCLDCGVAGKLFEPYQVLVVRGSRWIVCEWCRQLKPCRSPSRTSNVYTCSHEIFRQSPLPRGQRNSLKRRGRAEMS